MKARCPTKCGRDLGDGHFVTCADCWPLVSPALKHELSTYDTAIRQTRNPFLKQKYFKLQRSARERAVQWVIDRRAQKVSA